MTVSDSEPPFRDGFLLICPDLSGSEREAKGQPPDHAVADERLTRSCLIDLKNAVPSDA